MTDEKAWARTAVMKARASLGADPLLDKALKTLVRIINQNNTSYSMEGGKRRLCFYFPDPSPIAPTRAIGRILVGAGWTRVKSDMAPARPVKFERMVPAN